MVIALPTAPEAGAVSALTTRSGWSGVMVIGAARPLLVSLSSAITALLSATAETNDAPTEALAGIVRIVLAAEVAPAASEAMSRTPIAVPVPGVGDVERKKATRKAAAGAGPWFLIVLGTVIGLPTAPLAGAVSAVTVRSGWKGVIVVIVAAARPLFVSSSSVTTPPLSATAVTKYAPGEVLAAIVSVALAAAVAPAASEATSRNPSTAPVPGVAVGDR